MWQSTVFAVLAGLLTMAFRKNRAQVRYWLWFSASVKFLVPFWFLMSLGSRLGWTSAAKSVAAPAVSFAVEQIALPFSYTAPPVHSATVSTTAWIWLVGGLWVCGFVVIALIRLQGWLRVRAAVRSSTPIAIPALTEVRSTPVRSTPGLLEPGIAGFFRPVLLLPEGITERLTEPQLDAILAHEACHVQRRDNLTSAIHMVVEAVFWFHPLVWWIGARLLEERERACDEMVLGLGNRPRDYAEGILYVCKNYVESPLSCVSGVTGSNLKRRIQAILTGRVARELTFTKKVMLAAAGVAVLGAPVVIGAMSAPRSRIQASRAAALPKFMTASIKPCAAFHNGKVPEFPGRLQTGCKTLQRYMQGAYGAFGGGQANPLSSVTITGGPAWTDSDLYEIDAEAGGPEGQLMMKGPMLQALLEERFRLKVHRETREIPVYELSIARGGAHLEPYQGNCVPWDYDHPNPGPQQCATARPTQNGAEMEGWTMADFSYFLMVTLGRPVIDNTGNTERFNVHLELSTEAAAVLRQGARGAPVRTDLGTSAADPVLVSGITAAVQGLGLNLNPANAPGEFIVIDSAERPSEN